MQQSDLSANKWFQVGFNEGSHAGTVAMGTLGLDFEPRDGPLARGVFIVDGVYNVIQRNQSDFDTFEDGAAWMSGVHTGVASVRAWIAYTTEFPVFRGDGNTIIYVLVTDYPRELSPSLN